MILKSQIPQLHLSTLKNRSKVRLHGAEPQLTLSLQEAPLRNSLEGVGNYLSSVWGWESVSHLDDFTNQHIDSAKSLTALAIKAKVPIARNLGLFKAQPAPELQNLSLREFWHIILFNQQQNVRAILNKQQAHTPSLAFPNLTYIRKQENQLITVQGQLSQKSNIKRDRHNIQST